MWGSPGERENQVDTSSAFRKATFGRTWIKKKHFNWSFRANFSHLNAVQRVDAHVQEDTIQNLRMRSSKSHKLLFKYRHGNLGKDGRHEGWEANQDENHNVGHPGSAQVVVFSCYFWWTQINPNELTQKARVAKSPNIENWRLDLFSRTPKNRGFSPGAAVSVSILRLWQSYFSIFVWNLAHYVSDRLCT